MKLGQHQPCSVIDLLLSDIMAPPQMSRNELLLAEALKTHFSPLHKALMGAVFLIR